MSHHREVSFSFGRPFSWPEYLYHSLLAYFMYRYLNIWQFSHIYQNEIKFTGFWWLHVPWILDSHGRCTWRGYTKGPTSPQCQSLESLIMKQNIHDYFSGAIMCSFSYYKILIRPSFGALWLIVIILSLHFAPEFFPQLQSPEFPHNLGIEISQELRMLSRSLSDCK